MGLNNLFKILVCLGITLVVINLYNFILMVCFGKLQEAISAGSGVLIGILAITFLPSYRKEAIDLWKNIKQNYFNRKGR